MTDRSTALLLIAVELAAYAVWIAGYVPGLVVGRRFVPRSEFFMDSGKPPALVRFAGPRNDAGQTMRLE